MLKLHDFCNRAGARILWCTPVFGQAVGTQHIDEILAVWYPTHKTFLDLSDAPGAKESYRLRGACVAYAVIHRCSGNNTPRWEEGGCGTGGIRQWDCRLVAAS